MQKKKKKVKKNRVIKEPNANESDVNVTDQDARGHTGQYGHPAAGAGMKGNITKANKGSTGTRGR